MNAPLRLKQLLNYRDHRETKKNLNTGFKQEIGDAINWGDEEFKEFKR